jgi:type I restriction enzyme S subunit
VVIHGLDGFSGAIGDSQRRGVCSPVYHVCSVIEGDSAFYGRLLRVLAISGYLGNFATSTRERAVDFRNWDLFRRIPIPRVPSVDQRRIGEEIRSIRPLREKIVASEALAKVRRQALITAAVTGQLDIPEVAHGNH